MDKAAIEKIQSLAVQAAQIENINDSDTPVVALHQDFVLHDLEKYMENRARFRGTFSTHLASEFAQYFAEHHDENTRVFVNSWNMTAEAVFNLGTYNSPGHCDHTAQLTLDRTREFKALLTLDSTTGLSQRDMVDWIEDWRDHITANDNDGKEVELKRFIAAIRNVEISASRTSEHSDGDFSASKSTLEQIEAKSRHGLPNGFLFSCNPYQELDMRDIYVRLRIVTADDPRLSVRIVGLEALLESLQREFVKHLTDLLDNTNATILIGKFAPGK